MPLHSSLSASEAAALLSELPPMAPVGRNRALADHIHGWGPLGEEHAEALRSAVASGPLPAATIRPIQSLRASHHRIARLLALGTPQGTVANLCGITTSRISVLKHSPAFVELLDHYRANQDEAWADFVTMAGDLSMDALSALREMMDEHPEKFSPGMLLEIVKVTADRTGNAPMTKTVNVNLNADMGARMMAAEQRERAARRIGPPDAE